jgi:hypothetical protein
VCVCVVVCVDYVCRCVCVNFYILCASYNNIFSSHITSHHILYIIALSMSTEFPHTLLFVQTSASAFNSIRGVWNNLKTLSQHQPKKWNVTIVMKVPRSPTYSGDKKKHRETHSNSVLFMKYLESGATCMLNMTEGPHTVSDVVVCEHGIEELMTGIGGLELRSSWKTQGQSYNLGDFIVSAGVLERGSMTNTAVIEVSCANGEIITSKMLHRVYSLIDVIVGGYSEDMHVFGADSLDSSLSGTDQHQQEQSGRFTLAHRCLLWVDMLQL